MWSPLGFGLSGGALGPCGQRGPPEMLLGPLWQLGILDDDDDDGKCSWGLPDAPGPFMAAGPRSEDSPIKCEKLTFPLWTVCVWKP